MSDTGVLLQIERSNGGAIDMARPVKLETLEDVKQHIAYRDGQFDRFLEDHERMRRDAAEQRNTCQAGLQSEIAEIRKDLKEMRTVIYRATGGAAAVGAVLGIVAAALIQAVLP